MELRPSLQLPELVTAESPGRRPLSRMGSCQSASQSSSHLPWYFGVFVNKDRNKLELGQMRIPLPALVVPIVMLLLYFFPGLRQMPWTLLRIAGAVVARTNYGLFLPFVALLVMQFARAGREAKVLQEKFERL